jgi:hypothetical protein
MKKAIAPWLMGAALCGLAVACNGNTKSEPPGPTGAVGPAPQPVPIRRLTTGEYASSVADLFPGFTMPQFSLLQDPKVLGFTNFSSSQTGSLVWAEQYEAAAEAIAKLVAADPTMLTGCDAAVKGEVACAQPYLFDLAKRAYRRPLTDAEKQALTGLLNLSSDTVPYQNRLWLSIEGILLSPKFLFRPEFGDTSKAVAKGVPLTTYEIATRLSYFIRGSIPDAELTASADSGDLANPAEIKRQAQRLLLQQASQDHLVLFHEQWLGIDTISALTKDPTVYPTFSPLLASEMGEETTTFLQNVLFKNPGTFTDLFTASYTFANADLAAFYGVAPPANDWDKVQLDPSQRSGILTQASLLGTLAKDSQTDPVRRGKFILNQILCQTIPSPTPAIVALFQPMDTSQTMRVQFEQHRDDPICATCHSLIDPLGLPFEHYDGTGAWRDTDRGMDLDVTGSLEGVPFDGIPQLSQLIVGNPETRGCYATQWFRFANGRLEGDSDTDYLTWLSSGFAPDTKLIDLVTSIAQSDSFRYITPASASTTPPAGSSP